MSNVENIYDLEEVKEAQNLKFIFISSGTQDVVKAIQYSYLLQLNNLNLQQLNGKDVYNLGFGDYNLENDTLIDTVNTNNGDVYKVFNTVLSTVPNFFENYTNSILIVQGSDSSRDFIEQCKQTCKKGCGEKCKKSNRRINIYKNFVNKNYEQLILDYQFIGGLKDSNNQIVLEEYIKYKDYDSVLLLKIII